MPSQRQFEEIASNPMSTPAQVAAAAAQLYRIANPTKVVVQEVDLTAEPNAEPKAAIKSDYLPINRVGLIFSGMNYFEDPTGFDAADAAIIASGRCPEWDGPKYRAKQVQNNIDDCACAEAKAADRAARIAKLLAENPTWTQTKQVTSTGEKFDYDYCKVMNAIIDQEECRDGHVLGSEGRTTFKMIVDVPTKVRFDETWTKFEVVPATDAPPAAVPVAVAVAPVKTFAQEQAIFEDREAKTRQSFRDLMVQTPYDARGSSSSRPKPPLF
jgi:hypothetical protein